MNSRELSSDFDTLKSFVHDLYVQYPIVEKGVVSQKDQLKEIELLQLTLTSNDRFFFVIDMQDFAISHVHGVQKWLGYPEKEFSLKFYWDKVVHQSRRKSLLIIAQQMYATLGRGTYPLEFMVQRFSTIVPLKHYNGHYILAKKTASVFQYNSKNQLMAYMDEFTIINHEFNGEPLNPVMYNSEGELEVIKQKAIMEKAFEHFINMKIFSAGELQAARLLAYAPSLTQAEIASQLGLSTHTINTFHKRFLSKARTFFNLEFNSVLDASQHLKREGLL